jgi:hypothetical protein
MSLEKQRLYLILEKLIPRQGRDHTNTRLKAIGDELYHFILKLNKNDSSLHAADDILPSFISLLPDDNVLLLAILKQFELWKTRSSLQHGPSGYGLSHVEIAICDRLKELYQVQNAKVLLPLAETALQCKQYKQELQLSSQVNKRLEKLKIVNELESILQSKSLDTKQTSWAYFQSHGKYAAFLSQHRDTATIIFLKGTALLIATLVTVGFGAKKAFHTLFGEPKGKIYCDKVSQLKAEQFGEQDLYPTEMEIGSPIRSNRKSKK